MAIIRRNEHSYASSVNYDVILSQAEYDALPNSKLTDNKVYFITDAEQLTAETMPYDNTMSVKDKIGEVESKVGEIIVLDGLSIAINSTYSNAELKNAKFIVVFGYKSSIFVQVTTAPSVGWIESVGISETVKLQVLYDSSAGTIQSSANSTAVINKIIIYK